MTTLTTTQPRIVRFLASVTSEAEAALAAANGADIIDCKNPSHGALGALPCSVVTAIRRAVPQAIPVSATIGDLPAHPEAVVRAARQMAETGCDIVKIGFFPGGDAEATIHELGRAFAQRRALVAVLMAEDPPNFALIPRLGEAGFVGVMLDTAVKNGRTLCDHRTVSDLARFISEAHAAGLFAGLAGSLRVNQIGDLMPLRPDVLGFRGALCRARDRVQALDTASVIAVRRAMSRENETTLSLDIAS